MMTDWVDFALGEDIRNEHRQLQDKYWSNAVADGRIHISNRETVLVHRYEAIYGIESYYNTMEVIRILLPIINSFLLSVIVDFAFAGHGQLVFAFLEHQERIQKNRKNSRSYNQSLTSSLFRIYARKRPLRISERDIGCYDSCNAINHFKKIILHDCKLARNGRRLNMLHKTYLLDQVFDHNTSNYDVCLQSVKPLLQWVKSGKNATFLCFGQTGTGKTYTLNGILEYLSNELRGQIVEVTFFEIHGKKCYDLLSNRKVVHLRSDEHEKLHVRGARSVYLTIHDSTHFMNIIFEALRLRSLEVTERNPISSRSHAICMIEIQGLGKLTLVDLAGSERNYETVQMTAAQHRESADINFTLMCLKDCLRAYHIHMNKSPENNETSSSLPRIPYRSSLLTRVLKDCFTSDYTHRTTIMATISPSPIDIQHSINTLDHVTLMSSKLQSLGSLVTVEIPKYIGAALSDIPVFKWSAHQVITWLATAENGRFAHIVVPLGMRGEGLLRLNSDSLAGLFAGDIRAARAEEEGVAWVIEGEEVRQHVHIARALWVALRRENQVAIAKASTKIEL